MFIFFWSLLYSRGIAKVSDLQRPGVIDDKLFHPTDFRRQFHPKELANVL